MRIPNHAEVVSLWEQGLPRHAVDRALLLCGCARPDLPPSALADLPIGAVNNALLRLRAACFGALWKAHAECAACGQRSEFILDARALAASSMIGDACVPFEVGGWRFRTPHSRDLAQIAQEPDVERAARRLLELCCVQAMPGADLDAVRQEVEARIDALDPAADLAVTLDCSACGQRASLALDVGSMLFDEFAAQARELLVDVHTLASAYGWAERDILALSPARRAAYLEMVR